MMTLSSIQLLKNTLPEETWPWVITALRQDSTVWNSLDDPDFLELAIKTLGSKPQNWSPKNLSLISLDDSLLNEDFNKTNLNNLSPDLYKEALQTYQNYKNGILPEVELRQAGLLALHLYQQPNLLRHILWKTPLVCLFDLFKDTTGYLSQIEPKLAVHVVLANPLHPEEQKDLFNELLSKTSLDKQLATLTELSIQRFDLAADLTQEINKKDPHHFVVGNIRLQGKKNLSYLSNILVDTAVYSVSNQQDEYQRTITKALTEVNRLHIMLTVHQIDSLIKIGDLKYAHQFLKTNQSQFNIGQDVKIIISLYKYDHTNEIQTWFDGNLFLEVDSEDPDYNLAMGIYAYLQKNDEPANTFACKAFDGYKSAELPTINSTYQLARLFQALDQPEKSIQSIDLTIKELPNNLDALILKLDCLQAINQHKEAIKAAHLVVALAPERIDLRRLLATNLENDNQWSQAINEREAIISSQETVEKEDLYKLASCALHADRPQRTASVCQQILLNHPEEAEAHQLLGEAYISLGDPNKARDQLDRAIAIAPDSIRSWLILADLNERLNLHGKSREVLQAASHANPDNPEIQLALGKAYLKDKAFTQAMNAFRTAEDSIKNSFSKVDPILMSDVAESLGNTLLQLGHMEEAQTTLLNAYNADPTHIGVAHAYARVLLANNSPKEALPILSAARIQYPDNLGILIDFAKACLKLGVDLANVKDTLENVLLAMPHNIEAKTLLAESYEMDQDFTQAFEIYRDALNNHLEIDPYWHTRLSLGLGRVSLKLEQPEIAIAILKNALIGKGEDVEILKTLSQAYHAADLKEKALSVAKMVLKMAPYDDSTLDWFTQQTIDLNATDEAIEALQQSINRNPDRADLLTKLGWVYLYNGTTETARDTFIYLKSLDHINSSDLYNASQGLLSIGDTTNALDCLDKAIYMSKSAEEIGLQAKYYLAKTVAQQQNGDLQGALKTINESIEVSPENPELLEKKSRILSNMNQYEEAKKCIEKGIEKFPENTSLRLQAIKINRTTGDLPSAAKHAMSIFRLSESKKPGLLNPSSAAIIADLAAAMLQKDFAKEIIAQTILTNEKVTPNDLSFYCLQAELSLDSGEEVAAANALTTAIMIDPEHPRVLALQARLGFLQGESETAKQMLQQGLKAVGNFPTLNRNHISTKELGGANLADYPACTYIALAEASIWFQQWSVTNYLIQKAIRVAPEEPRSHFAFARAIVLRAEHQRLCQLLEIVNHAPGQSAIAEYAYQQFEDAILKAAHLLTELTSTLGMEFPDQREPKAIIATWLARGQAIFQPSEEHTKALANLSNRDGNIPAYIAALRGASKQRDIAEIVQKIYEEIGEHSSDPQLLGEIALTISQLAPEIGAQAIHTAIEVSTWRNNPNRPIYNAIQAVTARQQNNPDLQLEALQAALSAWSDEPYWLAWAADLHLQQGSEQDITHATQYLEQAIKLIPSEVVYPLKLAKVYQRENNRKETIRVLEQASQNISQQPDLWLALAQVYYTDADIPQAIRCAKNAIQIKPTNLDAFLLLAQIALEVDNPQKASDYLDDVLAIEPDNTQALLLQSNALDAQNKPHEALAALEKVIPKLPDSLYLNLDRVQLVRKAYGEEAALDVLYKMNTENHQDPKILSTLAQALAKFGQVEVATQKAHEALVNAKDRLDTHEIVGVLVLLGRLLRISGQQDQAIHHLSEAIELAPNIPGAYIELGRCFQEQREYKKGIQAFQNAIAIDPSDQRPFYFAGLVLKETKDFVNAEIMFKKAAQLAPTDLNIHRQLGAVTAINIVRNRQGSSNLVLPVESIES
ncbi:MAG: tetratricopeptide repeat protein [Anaerolineales bacterium]|nr:tetratricopeptide repeat protein [Anaerolineales bacterium]